MLHIITGPAGSGKTALATSLFSEATAKEKPHNLFIVPEQFSHSAERELCRVCGDRMSLYGEVVSFTRLASHIAAETNIGARRVLDSGGRILAMSLALDAVSSRLKLYKKAARSPEMRTGLLSAMDEFHSACITPELLAGASSKAGGSLGDKLYDMSLISGAYEAVLASGKSDPSHRLDLLAQAIPHSSVGEGEIFIDGFVDFTAQELGVIRAFLKKGAEVTVCLTCDDDDSLSELHSASRRSIAALKDIADKTGTEHKTTRLLPHSGSMRSFIEKNLFGYTEDVFDAGGSVRLSLASGIYAECEGAATRVLELVRTTGCRFRDIAVAVRGFEDYRPIMESVFEHYGVPLYLSRRSDILQRPVCLLISSAFETITGAWEYDNVFACLKTGLAGLSQQECDTLENYVLLWDIHGSMWTREEDWGMSPGGYGTEPDSALLEEINALRRRFCTPLLRLRQDGRKAATAEEQAKALTSYLAAIGLPQTLSARSAELLALDMEEAAAEYLQLWDIITGALEQFCDVLGDTSMTQDEFARLFRIVIGSYDIGTIPVSLDRVNAGEMDRVCRRGTKHMIVLGASDDRLPQIADGSGIFSPDEREELLTLDIDIGSPSDSLYREFNLIYRTLTLPSESLTVSLCTHSGDGTELRPSFIIDRLTKMFGITPLRPDERTFAASAPRAAFELAASSAGGDASPICAAAEKYFRRDGSYDSMLTVLGRAAALSRGALSENRARALYGDRPRLSSSRIDSFSSCRFAYFLRYGLRAAPRRPSGFNPPEMGLFIHFVLENAARDIMDSGGFSAVTREQTDSITDKYIKKYIDGALGGFRDKTKRFAYLFRRLTKSVRSIVGDMAQEMSVSDFTPLDFELDFSRAQDLPPLEVSDGESSVYLTGIADRVDGWLHDGKLYLRVTDYKTGKKAFSLSDVWYGMNLQMLLYLFALSKSGAERYGHELVPAGVSYVPARDALVSSDTRISGDELDLLRAKALRRSGLMLKNDDVLAAMERGEKPKYIPVTLKNGEYSGDNLATLEQFGLLSKHIEKTLLHLSSEIRRGSIDANPYVKSRQESACTWCDYRCACHFDIDSDKCRFLKPLSAERVWEMLTGGEDNG